MKRCPKNRYRVYQCAWNSRRKFLMDDVKKRYRAIDDNRSDYWLATWHDHAVMKDNGHVLLDVPIREEWLK